MKWKLVPVDDEGTPIIHGDTVVFTGTAPDPREDAELVERLKAYLFDMFSSPAHPRKNWERETRDILAFLNGDTP